MKTLPVICRKFARIIWAIKAWRRIKKTSLFDSSKYIQINPELFNLPWYMPPPFHWLLFGRGIDDLKPTDSHLKNAQLNTAADDLKQIAESDKAVFKALDRGDVEKVKMLLPFATPSCAIPTAHWIACKKMDVGPALNTLLKLNTGGNHVVTALQARQWIDMARASGTTTRIAHRTLSHFLPKMRPQERVFLARLPLTTDLAKHESKTPQLFSFFDLIYTQQPFLQNVFDAATLNETTQLQHYIQKLDGSEVITRNSATLPELPIVKVRIPMPIYWTEPQRSHSVLGPVTRVFSYLIDALLSQGHTIFPVWATPIYDVSAEVNHGFPTISYHTICDVAQSVMGDLHFKESYLPGWFNLDTAGFSGWSTLASWPPMIPIDPTQDAIFVHDLKRKYLDQNHSKYSQTSEPPPDAGYIFAALQVPNDTVSALAHLSAAEWTQELLNASAGHRVVFKRHPKDTSTETDALLTILSRHDKFELSRASVGDLISGAKVVVTTNSGVGFEALIGGRDVITCGRSDYNAAAVEVKTANDLVKAVKDALSDNHAVSKSSANAFVRYYMEQTCFTLENLSVLKKALNLT